MFTVYVLQSSDGRLYKGMTVDLVRRLSEHNRGETRTTSKMQDLKVVYTEEHATSAPARKRERYMKSAAGRKFLKKTLGL